MDGVKLRCDSLPNARYSASISIEISCHIVIMQDNGILHALLYARKRTSNVEHFLFVNNTIHKYASNKKGYAFPTLSSSNIQTMATRDDGTMVHVHTNAICGLLEDLKRSTYIYFNDTAFVKREFSITS